MECFLQPDVSIRTEQGWPVLMRCGVRVSHRLQVAEALALTFLAATGDPDKVSLACSECLPDHSGTKWVQRVLDRYWTYLGRGSPRTVDLTWLETLKREGFRSRAYSRREAAPAAIVWLVTLACNRQCPYCFYDVSPHAAHHPDSPKDATLSFTDAKRMICEMAQIGATDLYLTGGEPMLRRDLPELIEVATSVRVRTHLVTKYPVTTTVAKRLADAGLTQVTFSLDDARAKEAAALAGSSAFLEEAVSAITALLHAGLALEVNAVATRVNIDHLNLLVQFLIELGVPRLTLGRYTLPYPFRPSAINLLPARDIDLKRRVDTLRDQYGHRIELGLSSSSDGSSGDPCSNQAVCDVGFRELHVLPDGRVTRCRYLPGHEGLIVGSLRKDTILDIWNCKELASFSSPSPGAYAATACHGCGSFEACNARGRCYFTALTRSGRLHAPDDFCAQDRAP